MFDKINCFCLNIFVDLIFSEKNCFFESQKLKKNMVVKYGNKLVGNKLMQLILGDSLIYLYG